MAFRRDGPGDLGPILDSGEKTRLTHWRGLTKNVVRRELLEITGWLGRETDRSVLSHTPQGTQWVPAAEAANVVFLGPRTPHEVDQWDEHLLAMNMALENQRKAEMALERARDIRGAVETELERLDSEIRTSDASAARAHRRAAELEGEARRLLKATLARYRQSGTKPSRTELTYARRLVRRFREARARALELEEVASGIRDRLSPKRRMLAQRLERAMADISRNEVFNAKRVLAGFRAWNNAFLDMQALRTAAVAGEELRRHPRPNLRTADELEAELDRD